MPLLVTSELQDSMADRILTDEMIAEIRGFSRVIRRGRR